MERREFLGMAAKGAIGATALGIVGCSTEGAKSEPAGQAVESTAKELQEAVASDSGLPEINWQMATSWPPALDTIYGGAQIFAERVTAMTGGKFTITARAAGELVGGLEVLNAVEEGGVPIGHTAAYYYVGKSPATAFGTALPFGLTARQQNAWIYEGGGQQLMQDFYANKFGVIQFLAGNTGVQMGGWFNKEISKPADLQGLKMRIPGLGGKVMNELGVLVQVLPGGEIFQALQTGAIDACEWVGPYDDQKMGFHKVTKFYYYPGWWEPGPSLEVQINLDEWGKLPQEYQEIIRTAAYQANATMMARYDAKNPAALETLLSESDVQVLPFPSDVLKASEEAAFALFDTTAQENSDFATIFKEWKVFRDDLQKWHGLAETSMLNYLSA